MVWTRDANALLTGARVSHIGDAYQLAAAFANDMARLTITGEDPLREVTAPHLTRKAPQAACAVYGRGEKSGYFNGMFGIAPEATDHDAPATKADARSSGGAFASVARTCPAFAPHLHPPLSQILQPHGRAARARPPVRAKVTVLPKRTDIESILIIGAGPIVIGQACEFDYSGVQACKALRAEGYRIILVNSNPATIMTDPEVADATYIEPITPDTVERIIALERPDALLPTMGGQTALNTALALEASGALARLRRGDDRRAGGCHRAGRGPPEVPRLHGRDRPGKPPLPRGPHPRGGAGGPAGRRTARRSSGRPSPWPGTGGGIAYNMEEFREIVERGLDLSPTNEVLIEESVLGWKEYEMEVVRDKADNCIIICSIENIDPMGVHTGDSITVAPALTLTDKEYQRMRSASIAVLRAIGVETGGSNVQFAVNPADGRMVVIEMNPRVSRSSALASKATGFPIAKVAARLAVGYTLDELTNDITGATPASFEPSIDYVVTKIPRFAFEKFPGAIPISTPR